jgi:Fe-S oxidoreductase
MSREGSLEAPTRHPLDWENPQFHDRAQLDEELERVFDICHGCRRCVSLCNSFPTLFDLVDESPTMEVDGVAKADYAKVVEQCYLCDLCFMTKCPYVPPHEWAIDFPHLMLRAKATAFQEQGTSLRNRVLASTDQVGALASLPLVAEAVNVVNRSDLGRKALAATLGVHPQARVPEYHSSKGRNRLDRLDGPDQPPQPAGSTSGKVALFVTCYGNYNAPQLVEDLARVLIHNGITVTRVRQERCCGMPKLELGDLQSVAQAKEQNIPQLLELVEDGWDLIAPVPSCVLMFKQELPLMFPHDAAVARVKAAFFDPFEYLLERHRYGLLRLDFKQSLGRVLYHAACHQRVQNIGPKTRDLLQLIPGTEVQSIERCSGHDGTYGVKAEYFEFSKKICRPIVRELDERAPDHYGSDCPMAGAHIENFSEGDKATEHPLSLLRLAYGI